jgi:hypothetical protein
MGQVALPVPAWSGLIFFCSSSSRCWELSRELSESVELSERCPSPWSVELSESVSTPVAEQAVMVESGVNETN